MAKATPKEVSLDDVAIDEVAIDEVETAPKKAAEPPRDRENELVTVELYWDGERYTDDVDLAINGKRILLKRGQPIQIKRCYARVLKQSLKQDRKTKQMITKYAAECEQNAKSGAIS